jgi:hypothetical protein
MWERRAKPLVQVPGRRGHSREGKGFSIIELREAGLAISRARSLGIPVDTRRKTHYPENSRTLKMKYVITFSLREIKGIGKSAEAELVRAGISDARDLSVASIEELSAKVKYSVSRLERWQAEAKRLVEERLSQS